MDTFLYGWMYVGVFKAGYSDIYPSILLELEIIIHPSNYMIRTCVVYTFQDHKTSNGLETMDAPMTNYYHLANKFKP